MRRIVLFWSLLVLTCLGAQSENEIMWDLEKKSRIKLEYYSVLSERKLKTVILDVVSKDDGGYTVTCDGEKQKVFMKNSKQLILYVLQLENLEWEKLNKDAKGGFVFWVGDGKPAIYLKFDNGKLREASKSYGTMGGSRVIITNLKNK